MQPTEIQVQRCLQALEAGGPSAEAEPCDGSPSAAAGHGGQSTAADHGGSVPVGLVEFLADGSGMRLERMADARMRMASGSQPTAGDLADRMVGRLVCDRIR